MYTVAVLVYRDGITVGGVMVKNRKPEGPTEELLKKALGLNRSSKHMATERDKSSGCRTRKKY